ncbi:MarR family winged helix-turn-helix transcriptional regulator [Streptomyces sp. HPF1205]|uniref:MarR family winged helix-turn-helix transcriptional regulator n=1 Tax=Streptomyces sp. HPF1205 TaxID=2873262 RepID=UPI001CEC6B6D|nr:MarR family winged helix-turn-helix transcriptional regulator [Streptomyces sp. HPF1205]
MSEFMDVYTRASKSVRAITEVALRAHGLHLGQNLVLAALWEEDGQTPGAIAAAVDVTTPTIVKMANRMTAAGLLTRRRDDRDNRLVRLYLTDAGRALREPVEKEMRALEQQLTAGFGDPDVSRLIASLTRMTENAHALGAAEDPLVR